MFTQFSFPAGGLILSVNPAHDGAVVILEDRKLRLSCESEHDSHPRHLPATAYLLLNIMSKLDKMPAVIATSGWTKGGLSHQSTGLPYKGVEDHLVSVRPINLVGQETLLFESTHERSHIFCSYGLSPFSQGEPCYVLVWEGDIGSFYELDKDLHIRQLGPVLPCPGYKYSFLYDLADPTAPAGTWRLDTAGKLMALAAFSSRTEPTSLERRVIDQIFRDVAPPVTDKQPFKDTPYFNCGVTNPAFRELVKVFSEALFENFYSYAKQHLSKGYPLVISGGCGLNCEWNSRWRDSGLFSDVFVPPVTNDAGTALGSAIEAQFALTGSAKIAWTVYSGEEFRFDENADDFQELPLDYDKLAAFLAEDKVVAWAQGRCEIGPRALGNRSLLAPPFHKATRDRLNVIKHREWYRPIAPVCLEEDAERLFGLRGSSPYMLYFQPSVAPQLEAVQHVDKSARVQTVSRQQNPALHELLLAFKRHTGFGVLCNTSLNRNGMGFLNQSSDLFAFVRERKIDAAIIGSRWFLPVAQRASSEAHAAPEPGKARTARQLVV